MRIAKFIAAAGICSRRDAEKLIEAGRVKIDGQTIASVVLNVTTENIIEVDGKVIKPHEAVRVWVYYKPVGLVTTHKDPQNRPTVFAALEKNLPRVISVGRLDLNSEGLLLLTNSGEFARKFELPASKIMRVYKVRAYGNITRVMEFIASKEKSLKIKGITYRFHDIRYLSGNKMNLWFEVSLFEGKNREIRKIFEALNLKVNRLIRTKYGKYELEGLKPGEFREE